MQDIEGVLVCSPTDLVAFSGCEHRTHLDLLVARGELERPVREDAFTEVLRKHGRRHEGRHLAELRAATDGIREIDRPQAGTLAALRGAEAQTLDAMRAGVAVVYQASFFDGRWRGHADFVCRVDRPSRLGAWSYEAHDTKLARQTKAGTLLQLGDYSRQLARLQGLAPRSLHVVLGDGRVESFLYADVSAYLDAVRARFQDAVDRGLLATAPDPVEMCQYCGWKDRCSGEWRAADHLSLVAGIRRDQRVRLVAAGVGTRTALAGVPQGTEVPHIRDAALTVLREQAALQVQSAEDGGIAWSLIEAGPDAPQRGLAALPAPSPGDVFFDMEGDRFVGIDGLEYLFGWVEGGAAGAPFRTLWAHDPAAEKAAFEMFIDTVMAWREHDPGMHVYHYAAYEPSTLKRLMGRYATREDEVDVLLRAGVFVDLYDVVRHGVRVGVESYSIKKLEPLYKLRRIAEVTDAGTSVVQYERWLDEGGDAILESIRAYNEDDCRSLVGLRDWLEERRAELEERVGMLARPPLVEGSPSEAVARASATADQLAATLTDGVPVDPQRQTDAQRGLSLLAALLDWHRRDAKPGWWEYFTRRKSSDDELVEDPAAVGGLEFDRVTGVDKKSQLFRFTFPVQETKLSAGTAVEDPRASTDASGNPQSRSLGKVHGMDAAAGWVVLKRQKTFEPMPRSLVPSGPVTTPEQSMALLRLGEWVRDHGFDGPGPFRAQRDLLLRNRPRINGVADGEPLRREGEDIVAAARRCVADADRTCLPIQGPPGTGKTRAAAIAIVDCAIASPPRRAAVTALSHRAITHLLQRVCEEARGRGVTLRIMQKSDGRGCEDALVRCVTDARDIESALDAGTVDVVAGTSWLLAPQTMEGKFDTLFVDEAGQLSLADVVAIGGCAANIVLLGDPQQLQQPSNGSHPPGAGASALGHLLGEDETIAPDRGLFLDRTWRLHPDVCAYISQTFYDSRLRSAADAVRQRVLGENDELSGTGLRWLPVAHAGNRSASEQEARRVATLVVRLAGRRWVDRDGVESTLTGADILVVAPYNAHVAALRRHLPDEVAVGTVDRFQGQEAAVVIYSMATSLAEDVPRGLDFLYSRNRMNVAVSRAHCMAILVCSPELLHVFCTRASTVPLVNALCAYVQRATLIGEERAEFTQGALEAAPANG